MHYNKLFSPPFSNGSDTAADNVLKTLEEECFTQLKNAISQNFPDLKSVYLALPIECFREIAEKLPASKAEMLEIDQMTHFRYDRFGAPLLEVCKVCFLTNISLELSYVIMLIVRFDILQVCKIFLLTILLNLSQGTYLLATSYYVI